MRTKISMLALEPRWVFDGAASVDTANHDTSIDTHVTIASDPVAVAPTAPAPTPAPTGEVAVDTGPVPSAAPASPTTFEARLLVEGDPSRDGGRREVAFVDTNVADWQTLVAAVRPGIEVVLLDGRGDGLKEMADYLADHGPVDTIHVISHGSRGELFLGALDLTAGDLGGRAADLGRIGAALSPDGDLLLYGCGIGEGVAGRTFVDELASATGANVAASNDTTGPTSLGGDWVLETSAGTVGSSTAFDPASVETYAHDLGGSYTVTTGINVDTAKATTGLIGAGKLITFDPITIGTASSSASLILNAYDVDYGLKDSTGTQYPTGSASSEWDGVYVQKVGDTSWQFVGYLTGSNNTWNYTTLDITGVVQAKGAGSYLVRVVPDDNGTQSQANNGGRWVVGVASAQIVVDGGAHAATLSNVAETASAVSASVTASTAGTYTVEFNLIDTSGHDVASISRVMPLSAGVATAVSGTLAVNTNFYSAWSSLPSGNYTLQVTLVDANGVAQDTATLPYTNVTSASVPASTGIAALVTGLDAASWTGTSTADLQHVATTDTSPKIIGQISKVASSTSTTYVDVYADGTFLGTASVAANSTSWSLQLGAGSDTVNASTATLSAGTHALSAVYSSTAKPSVAVNYVEGGAALAIDPNITLVGSGTITGVNVWINSGVTGDTLAASTAGTNITATYSNGVLSLSAASETIAHFQQVLDAVTFRSTSIDPTNQGANTARTISWQVKYKVGNTTYYSDIKTTTVNVAATNDAPTLSGGGNTSTWSVGGGAVFVNSAIRLTDDTKYPAQATVSLTGNRVAGEDVLAFTNSSSTLYGNIAASFDASTGVLTLTSSGAKATQAQWAAALAAVSYSNSSATPTTGNRTVTFQIDDGQSANHASNIATSTVAVSAATVANRAPQLTGGGNTAYYNGSSVSVGTNLTLADTDTTTMTSATVSIGTGFLSGDRLSFTASSSKYGNIAGSFSSSTGVLTLTSSGATATMAQWQAALRSVKFSTTNSINGTSRVVNFQVDDGQASNHASNVTASTVTLSSSSATFNQNSNSNVNKTPASSPAITTNVGAATSVPKTTSYSSSAPVYSLLIDAPSSITPAITAVDGTTGLTSTTDRTPVLSGTAAAGVTLKVFEDGVLIGTTTADASGKWSLPLTSAQSLANGTYGFTVQDVVNTRISTSYGLAVSSLAPDLTVTDIHISDDTGVSATDFITGHAGQTITASLSAPLSSGVGNHLWASLDGGRTWTDVTAFVSGTTLTWTGATLKTGYYDASNYILQSIQMKVGNASGYGAIASQDYLLVGALGDPTITGTTFVVGNTPTLLGTADPNSVVTVTWLEGGVTHTGTAQPNASGAWSFTVPAPLADGGYTFNVSASDPVTGATSSAHPSTSVTIDSTLPIISGTITISSDTGVSASDYVTRTAAQTIGATLDRSLGTGQTLWASLDGGGSWTDVTGFVSGTTLAWTGSGATLPSGSHEIDLQVRNVTTSAAGAMATRGYVLDTVAPTLPVGAVVVDTTAMVLTLNVSELGSGLDTSAVPSVSDFVVRQNGTVLTLTGSNATVAVVDGNTVTITLQGIAATSNDTFTLSYGGTSMRDVAGNLVATTSAMAVLNPSLATAIADTGDATEASGLANAVAGTGATGSVLVNDGGIGLSVTQIEAGASIDANAIDVNAGSSATSSDAAVIVGTYGTLTIGADGGYAYVVDDANASVEALKVGQTLTETFAYQLTDGGGVTDTATLTITIHGANDAPVGAPDTASATEAGGTANATAGTDPTGHLLSNDHDVDSASISVTAIQAGSDLTGAATSVAAGSTSLSNATVVTGAHGRLTLGADGSWTYTVDNADTAVQAMNVGDTLTDGFVYRVTDADGASSTSTLVVTLHGADDAPTASTVATADAVAGSAMTAIVVPAFTDVDDASLTYGATLADGSALPAGLSFDAATRTLSGTPATAGVHSIVVTGTDGHGLSAQARFTLRVASSTPSSTPPTALDDASDATEAGTAAGVDPTGGVLTNDTSNGGGALSLTAIEHGGALDASASTVTGGTTSADGSTVQGSHGSLKIGADGSYAYTVDNADAAVQAMASGDTLTDTFTYRITDAGGATATATLTVTIHGANDAPVAQADTASATEAGTSAGTDPTGNVTTNDHDVDGATIPVTAIEHGGTLDASASTVAGGTTSADGTVVAGSHGSLKIGADGSYAYTVDNVDAAVQAMASGDTLTDTFTYRITDAGGATATATLTVTIHGANDAPVAQADTASATEAGTSTGVDPTGNVTANDHDVDGATIPVTAIEHGGTLDASASAVTGGTTSADGTVVAGSHGSLKIGADGSYAYTVDNADAAVQAMASGDTLTDTFTYRITDAGGATATATLTVTIHGANDAPVAQADTASATEAGTSAGTDPTGSVTANDHDVDGATIPVTAIEHGSALDASASTVAGGTTSADGTIVQGVHGSLKIGADGSYAYTVDNADAAVQAMASGDTLTDTFTYRITDAGGATATATLTVTIHGANDAPAAQADTASATEAGTSAGTDPTGNVTANDHDVDGATIPVTAIEHGGTLDASASTVAGGTTSADGTVVAGSHGSLKIGADGSYAYTVDNADAAVQAMASGDTLTDTFTYRITDAGGATATATLTVTIHGANDAPVAVGSLPRQSWTGGGRTSYVLPQDAFVDPDRGDAITLRATLSGGAPLPAWITFDPVTGTFTGTPTQGSHGDLDIVVTASDRTGASSSAHLALQFDTPAPLPLPPPSDPVTTLGSGGSRAANDQGSAPLVTIVAKEPTQSPTGGSTSGTTVTPSISMPLPMPTDASRSGSPPPSPSFTANDHGAFAVPVAPTTATGSAAALVVFHPIADMAVGTGAATVLQVPSDSFMHTDPTARVALTAIREDGGALPTWVTFDPQTGRFDVRPPQGYSGEIVIRVIARDQSGHEATQTFKIDVGVGRQGHLDLREIDPSVADATREPASRHGDPVRTRPIGRLGLSRQLEAMSAARSASHRALAASVDRQMRLS
jgi:VCBS repeat-containing protein